MYKEYFNLTEEPFNVTPDPRFLYMTAQHTEAFNHLIYGIRQRKGFICLTGEVGAGKTTLCRALLNELGTSCHTALILNPMLTGTQMLRAIVTEFGIDTKGLDRLGCLNELNRFLLSVSSAGRDAILIIDEAQDMSEEALELTRLLSNLETERQKLLQIILVGQPELRKKLSSPALRQLAQRITVRYHLGTMSANDTAQYIRHRLVVAAAPPPAEQLVTFEEAAIHEIHRHTGGTPRLVNSLGDKALLAGYVHRTGRIDSRLVRLAATELGEASG